MALFWFTDWGRLWIEILMYVKNAWGRKKVDVLRKLGPGQFNSYAGGESKRGGDSFWVYSMWSPVGRYQRKRIRGQRLVLASNRRRMTSLRFTLAPTTISPATSSVSRPLSFNDSCTVAERFMPASTYSPGNFLSLRCSPHVFTSKVIGVSSQGIGPASPGKLLIISSRG